MSPDAVELKQLLWRGFTQKTARRPLIAPVLHARLAPRSRASAVDITERIRRWGVGGWPMSRVEAALGELQTAGLVHRGEGGYAIVDLSACAP